MELFDYLACVFSAYLVNQYRYVKTIRPQTKFRIRFMSQVFGILRFNNLRETKNSNFNVALKVLLDVTCLLNL